MSDQRYGKIMLRITARLKREKSRGFVTTPAIVQAVKAPRAHVRRALNALVDYGDVITLPKPRRWALVKGRRVRARKALSDERQLDLENDALPQEKRGTINNPPRGGLERWKD